MLSSTKSPPDDGVVEPLAPGGMKAAGERNPAGDQATGDKKARPGHQERRQGFDRDFDAEIRGAPDEINSRKTGDQRGFGRNFIWGSHDFKML